MLRVRVFRCAWRESRVPIYSKYTRTDSAIRLCQDSAKYPLFPFSLPLLPCPTTVYSTLTTSWHGQCPPKHRRLNICSSSFSLAALESELASRNLAISRRAPFSRRIKLLKLHTRQKGIKRTIERFSSISRKTPCIVTLCVIQGTVKFESHWFV